MNTKQLAETSWLKEPTAILVFHGIGNQNPVETIDEFARTLVRELSQTYGYTLRLSHRLLKKSSSNGTDVWFDNFLRIERLEKLRSSYQEKVARSRSSAKLTRLVDELFAQPRVTLENVQKLLKVWPTSAQRFKRKIGKTPPALSGNRLRRRALISSMP